MNKKNVAKIKEIVKAVKNQLNVEINDEPIKEVIKEIEKEVKKQGIKVEVFLGGSYAKSTFLGNDFDCDIFLRFDKQYPENELSDLSEKLISKFKPKRIHGSRDYFNFDYKGISFEVVPVYLIKDPKEALNTTDVSPFHVIWFKEMKEKNPELPNEIKVAKVFLKAQKLYGAESYIRGFSGHVVDILIAYYGSFTKLILAATEWSFPVVIDIENHYRGLNPIFFLNKDKIKNEFIVIDPIIKERNAAAAISKENVIKFIEVCKQFLENPSKDFFEIKFLDLGSAKQRIGNNPGIIFQVKPLDEKSKDVAGTKAFKSFEFLKESLEKKEFKILDCFFDWDKKNDVYFFFTFDNKKLSKKKIILGPPNEEIYAKNINDFKSKYKDKVFLKDNRFYAEIEREFTNPFDYVEELVKDKRFLQNIKDFKTYKINESLIKNEEGF